MGTFVSSVEIKPERFGRCALLARLAAAVVVLAALARPAAAVVAGGVVTAIALSSPGASTVHAGTLETLSR